MDLTWTAPADYGAAGSGPYTSATYDLRFSTSVIDSPAAFAAATPVADLTAPKAPGSAEAFTITGLTGGARYYFAVASSDDSGNVSAISKSGSAKASVIGEQVLQIGLNGYMGVTDSYVAVASPGSNYGGMERMTVCGYGAGNYQRGMVKFDLSSLPAGANLVSAKLYLYAYNQAQSKGSSGAYGAYALAQSWIDSQVSWNLAKSGTNWATPGGDFDELTPDGTSPKQPIASVPCWNPPFDVTARVQSWLDGGSVNNGWVIKIVNEAMNVQDQFYQSDTANGSLRPKLVISDIVAAIVGDINSDGLVNVADLQELVAAWASNSGGSSSNWSPVADLNSDGFVNIGDLQLLVANWGM